MFTPWSLYLFSRVPSQLHGEHTVLQPLRRIELIIHISISVLPGTHFHLSQVKHLIVKCLAQGHNIETVPQNWDERHIIFLWKSCTKRDSKSHTGSDIGKTLRSNHCIMSLETTFPSAKLPSLTLSSHYQLTLNCHYQRWNVIATLKYNG